MARALDAEVVVEGSRPGDARGAARAGRDYAQGYLIGRPQTLEELLAGIA